VRIATTIFSWCLLTLSRSSALSLHGLPIKSLPCLWPGKSHQALWCWYSVCIFLLTGNAKKKFKISTKWTAQLTIWATPAAGLTLFFYLRHPRSTANYLSHSSNISVYLSHSSSILVYLSHSGSRANNSSEPLQQQTCLSEPLQQQG